MLLLLTGLMVATSFYDTGRRKEKLSNVAPRSVHNIEVSAITKHRKAVVAALSAKSRFSAKTVSVKPSF